MAGPHVALIGMPGVGKSTVARRLGARLSLDVVDLDDAIAEEAGCDVRAIFAEEGEEGFRERESTCLAGLLEPDRPRRIVACGGGVVLVSVNRELLARRATTVLVEVELDVLAQRLAPSAQHRPLLAGDLAERLATLRDERSARYEATADVRVDATDLDPDEVVDRIIEALS